MTAAPQRDSVTWRDALQLGAGGWVLWAALLLVLLALLWQLAPLARAPSSRARGNGRDPGTYGFDLSFTLVPREEIVAGGFPRDGLPALSDPPLFTAAEIRDKKTPGLRKFLVPRDRVIGVALGGAARAYPLRVLSWHEVVNDTLGGAAIAVTYSPLCDAAAVFDRRGPDGIRNFGVSGLLYNSNLLLYDRAEAGRGEAQESLWSQLQARAISGPAAAAGESLRVLPAALAHWEDWLARHPATTVLAADRSRAERYARDPYANYYGSDELRFPVEPLPPARGPAKKAPLVVVMAAGERVAIPLSEVAARADAAGEWITRVGGADFRLHYRADPPTVAVESAEPSVPYGVCYAFWFAWHAAHPGDPLFPDSVQRQQ